MLPEDRNVEEHRLSRLPPRFRSHFGSSGHLWSCVVSLRPQPLLFYRPVFLVSLMDPVRPSQQTTQPTSFPPFQPQYIPADVLVPNFTFDAQSSPISNTGSPCSGSADIAMCRPVSHVAGDGTPSTGVPPGCFETFLRNMSRRQTEQLAVLTNSIASFADQGAETDRRTHGDHDPHHQVDAGPAGAMH